MLLLSTPFFFIPLTNLDFVKKSDGVEREAILKKCYMEFFKAAKSVTWRTWEFVNFMKNGVVEMLSIDPEISYVIVFSIIQKWGKILKRLQKKVKKDSISALYNWGTINSLRVCVGCCVRLTSVQ